MAKNVTYNMDLPEGLPSEFLLLKFGETDTTQGPYRLDLASAKEIVTTAQTRKLKFNFDYNHASLDPKNTEDGIAAGWFDIELKEDGIWAKNIRWTPKAAQYLSTREFAYYSPAIKLNKNGYAIRLINVALTNLPATSDINSLVALSENSYRSLDALISYLVR